MPRHEVIDRWAAVEARLRPKSTAINPRYLIRDTLTGEIVDELTTKRSALGFARLYDKQAAS